MVSLTVSLSEETARKLAEHAAENGQSVEAWAARLVEDAYDDAWLSDLTPDDRAAIEEGLAEIDRGETVPHAAVVAEFRQKFEV